MSVLTTLVLVGTTAAAPTPAVSPEPAPPSTATSFWAGAGGGLVGELTLGSGGVLLGFGVGWLAIGCPEPTPPGGGLGDGCMSGAVLPFLTAGLGGGLGVILGAAWGHGLGMDWVGSKPWFGRALLGAVLATVVGLGLDLLWLAIPKAGVGPVLSITGHVVLPALGAAWAYEW